MYKGETSIGTYYIYVKIKKKWFKRVVTVQSYFEYVKKYKKIV